MDMNMNMNMNMSACAASGWTFTISMHMPMPVSVCGFTHKVAITAILCLQRCVIGFLSLVLRSAPG
eukprot:2595237-Prymnesium_polylepis.2